MNNSLTYRAHGEKGKTMYLVQSFDGSSNFYSDSLKEAEDVYFDKCNSSQFVQLLYGEPGHYETVRQSW